MDYWVTWQKAEEYCTGTSATYCLPGTGGLYYLEVFTPDCETVACYKGSVIPLSANVGPNCNNTECVGPNVDLDPSDVSPYKTTVTVTNCGTQVASECVGISGYRIAHEGKTYVKETCSGETVGVCAVHLGLFSDVYYPKWYDGSSCDDAYCTDYNGGLKVGECDREMCFHAGATIGYNPDGTPSYVQVDLSCGDGSGGGSGGGGPDVQIPLPYINTMPS